jgi:5-methylcytosine-specific restriction enzyme A
MPRLPTLPAALPRADLRVAAPMPHASDPHYHTQAHRRWSDEVIARAGGACQKCGRIGARLYADHKHEIKDGGARLDLANGEALCGSCHGKKSARARRARQG